MTNDPKSSRVAVIGLGIMGLPMASSPMPSRI
jgi:UDP-N-acetyl-D-mannosaminuronate dehydrogenase